MKIENHNIVETLGIVAVVLSLIFVGFELRQSNDIAIRDARNEITEKRSDIAKLAIENHSHRKLLNKLSDPNTDLTAEESIAVSNLAQLYIGYWAINQAAHEGGFLPESIYEVYLQSARVTFTKYPYLARAVSARFQEVGVGAELGGMYASNTGRDRPK